jgi:hypothetical protein
MLLSRASILAAAMVALSSCRVAPPRDVDADRAAVLSAHERILEAHRTKNLDDWLALETDTQIVGANGELRFVTRDERIPTRRSYLASATFTSYRDLRPPIVRVADDGSIAWLFAQVEIQGTRAADVGPPKPIDDVWVWIELYERHGDDWLLVGNVSSLRPHEPER